MEAQARMRAAKQPSDANAAAAAVAAGGRRDPAGGLRAYYTTDYATDYTTDIPRAYHALYPFLGCNAVSISFHEIPYMLVGGKEEKKLEQKKLGQKIGAENWRQQAVGNWRSRSGVSDCSGDKGTGRPPGTGPRTVFPRNLEDAAAATTTTTTTLPGGGPGEGRLRATAPTGVPLHPPYNRK